MAFKPTRLIVAIQGGLVRSIYTDSELVFDVSILDYDVSESRDESTLEEEAAIDRLEKEIEEKKLRDIW
jgi:hypothetical protein